MKNYNIPEITIKYKGNKLESFSIHSSKDAYEAFKNIFNSDTIEYCEECIMIALNRRNRTLGYFKVSQGGLSATIVDAKMIFAVLLKTGASGFILAHNHPSGDKNPSGEDDRLTKRLKEAAKLFDISFVDHLIVTSDGYTSMADEGLL